MPRQEDTALIFGYFRVVHARTAMGAALSDSLLLKQSSSFRSVDTLLSIFFVFHWHEKLTEFYFVQLSSLVTCKVTSFAHCSSQNPEDFLETGGITRHLDLACHTPLDLLQNYRDLFLNSETG